MIPVSRRRERQPPEGTAIVQPWQEILANASLGPLTIEGAIPRELMLEGPAWAGNGSTRGLYVSLNQGVTCASTNSSVALMAIFVATSGTAGTLAGLGVSTNSLGGYFHLYRNANGTLALSIDDAANTSASVSTTSESFNDGRIHCAVGWLSTGAAGARTQRLYVDGRLVASGSSAGFNTTTYNRASIGLLRRISSSGYTPDKVMAAAFARYGVTDEDCRLLSARRWSGLYQARRGMVPAAMPAGGITIACGVGAAVAAGQAAGIVLPTPIAGNVGSASAQGHAVAIEPHTVIAAGVGSGAADGLAADISTTTTIAAGQALAAGTGHQATITIGSGTTIPCGAGAGVAAGLPAAVAAGTSISCSTGTGSAAGQPVGIAPHLVIAGGVAQATADGMQTGIVLRLSVACTTGEAAAAGLPASVAMGADVPTFALPRYTLAAKPRRLELRARARRLEIGR